MRERRFQQVDVFTETPTLGNPVAVVLDAEDLSTEEMQRFAAWTNLSETTFVLPPTHPDADYRVRIFCPGVELPWAGHPTLGTCHAWLRTGGTPARAEEVVQESAAGLVRVRTGANLAFAAPPMVPSEPDPDVMGRIVAALGLGPDDVTTTRLLDNGVAWWTVLARDAATVLAIEPDITALYDLPDVGVVGLYPPGGDAACEVRAFAPAAGIAEDPVTGSLHASVGQWLIGEGVLPDRFVATQGARVDRAGRIEVDAADGDVWIGGASTTLVAGTVDL